MGIPCSTICRWSKTGGWKEKRDKARKRAVKKATTRAVNKKSREFEKLMKASGNLENALIMAAAQFEAALKAVQADAKQNGAGNMADGFRAKNLQSLAGAIKTAVDTRMLISGIMTAAEKEKLQIEREKLAMEKRREEREMAEMEGAENNEIHIVIEKDDGEEINVEDLMG